MTETRFFNLPALGRLQPLYLLFWEFAETCVFGKQSPSSLLLHPAVSNNNTKQIRRNTNKIKFFNLLDYYQKRRGGHLANLRPAFLPNSLNLFLSLALVYSTYLPVLVLSTVFACSRRDTFLGSQSHPTLLSFWEKRPSRLGLKRANGFSYRLCLTA